MAKKEESKSKYVVLPNNQLRVAAGDKDSPKKADVLIAGDEVELTESEAEAHGHAVGTHAEYKKAEQLEEAKKLLADDARAKALAEQGAKAQVEAGKK